MAAAALIVGLAGGVAIGAAVPGKAEAQLATERADLTDVRAALSAAQQRADDLADDNQALHDQLDAGAAQAADKAAATAAAEAAKVSTARFPDGYPTVVAVAELPDQVSSWYERSGYTQAVALAPGVWTPLSPGADMQDAIAAGVADGFCASKQAYETDYAGRELGGTCW